MPDVRIPADTEVNDPRQLSLLKRKSAREPVEGSMAYFEQVAAKMVGKALAEQGARPTPKKKKQGQLKPKLGKLIRLPDRKVEDPMLRLEQNLGCELPVCVGNRRDVHDVAIETTVNGRTTWRLTRLADTLLPAPEHYRFWLWFLDRCQAAARAGYDDPPRITINLGELYDLFGGGKGGTWYREVDEAFTRFSGLVVKIRESYHTPEGVMEQSATVGTLCYYSSWRPEKDKKGRVRKLEMPERGRNVGWIAPGPLLWASIRGGYLKAVPMQPMRQLSSYVAQRLLAYLTKHCQPGAQYKVALSKLLPKIPMQCPPDQIKTKLKRHHRSLTDAGFLTGEPVFEGRGQGLMVTYQR